MDRAAQLRAQGKDWPDEVAEIIGLRPKTVQQYPSRYPPFDELVDWYRDKLWHAEVERLVRQLQPEALRALAEVVDARDIAGTEVGPTFADLVKAAREILTATGFKERQKLRAREDVQGTSAEQLEVSGPEGGPIEQKNIDDGSEADDDAVLDALEMLSEQKETSGG